MQHTITWFEIPVTDMARATQFYETALNTQLRQENYGAPGDKMAVFAKNDEQAVTGCLMYSSAMSPYSQGTLIYLSAGHSIDECLHRVQAAGGQVLTQKTALPQGLGFFAHIQDSEGNRVGLHALA